MYKRGFKSVILLFFIMCIIFTGASLINIQKVHAASKYITREEFVAMVMKELGFEVNEQDSKHPYMEAAIRAGIITKSTFGTKYDAYLTKSDAAVVLVKADEYLNGVTIGNDMLEVIINERISDLDSASKARKPYIAKAYALGYLSGSSNGLYTRNRSMKPWQRISVTTAEKLVEMLNDHSKRTKLTEDGQVIRTTNLPEFAKYYPYILDSFPNEYYDWEFMYMKAHSNTTNKPLYGTEYWVSLEDYAAPKDFTKIGNGKAIWNNYSNRRKKFTVKEVYNLCANKWQANAERYLNLVFNVDYRTLADDKEWYQGIMETHFQYGSEDFKELPRLNKYIDAAIANKTIVESKLVGVDKSSVYMCMGSLYIRAHVKYRIISSKSMERVALSPIIFTNYTYPNIDNVVLGEWRDCYLDIQVRTDYESCGIREAIINDYFHDVRVVIK